MPAGTKPVFWLALVMSLVFHGSSYLNLESWNASKTKTQRKSLKVQKSNKKPIRIKVVQAPKKKSKPKPPEPKPDEKLKKILEVRQEETAAPEKANYVGQTNHIAKKETKVKVIPTTKGKDPSVAQKVTKKLAEKPPKKAKPPVIARKKVQTPSIKPQNPKPLAQKTPQPAPNPKVRSKTTEKPKQVESLPPKKKQKTELAKAPSKQKTGKKPQTKMIPTKINNGLSISSAPPAPSYPSPRNKRQIGAKARNAYEAFLNQSYSKLENQVEAGYQDYIKDKIAEGDKIDINTRHYRYIGYFTGMRKAIELVWNYPQSAARRGMQGTVGLEFSINLRGHATGIRVVKSSGYAVLDNAIVEAVRLASPFSPLPTGFKKKKLTVTGSFNYVLGNHYRYSH